MRKVQGEYALRARNFLIGPAKANRQGKNRTESREMTTFEGIPMPTRRPHFNEGLQQACRGRRSPGGGISKIKCGKRMKHGRSRWPSCGETLSTGSGGLVSIVLSRCWFWSRS